MVGVGLGVTAQDQGSAVDGWEVDVEHVEGGKLVEHRAWGEAGSQRPEPGAQRDVQTIGEEGHEDVRFDALLPLRPSELAATKGGGREVRGGSIDPMPRTSPAR